MKLTFSPKLKILYQICQNILVLRIPWDWYFQLLNTLSLEELMKLETDSVTDKMQEARPDEGKYQIITNVLSCFKQEVNILLQNQRNVAIR